MPFSTEAKFEAALIKVLSERGWETAVLKNPTEADLIANWAKILFDNNRGIDRLNDFPLTDGEMVQVLEQVERLKTPLKLNELINGKYVTIKRDHPEDHLHFGKEMDLKIYDRNEIAAGQSRYQIVQQPRFKSKSKLLNNRRGDLILLINGMPLIHIELKKSGIEVGQASNQIEKYANEGIFSGLFSLVQIFVAMTPEDSLYFANPGPDGNFNKDYYFRWADFDNEPIKDLKEVTSSLLAIPMAHLLIGCYTVADTSDGVLKVMRSYQYYAANAISTKVAKEDWKSPNPLGGYIWHTTGSGKTLTSFKSAQLIANSNDADKVVFLMDRIELGTQSLEQYEGFANANEDVQATENTGMLVTKLKSDAPANTLIVTSIQKMSNIKADAVALNTADIERINEKRIVFIVDEAHRSTFGSGSGTNPDADDNDDSNADKRPISGGMLIDIKKTFPRAIFFGFTGTPIQKENEKKKNTTSTVFGDELHRYSIADGIRDGNVLGFNPYQIETYKKAELRKEVALQQAKAKDEEEVFSDAKKRAVYNKYMNDVKMYSYLDQAGKYVKGIEDFLPRSQYNRPAHRNKVVEDIAANWMRFSQKSELHAIFATNSIPEAIAYYRLIKKVKPDLKITALFDPNIDNGGGVKFKQDGLVEIIEDYNERYGQSYTLATHGRFKKDIANRLSHKEPYIRIKQTPDQQIDLLIVVDQMLTGFDSKWVNTLYLDKMLKYESIIQAFSRTNRLYNEQLKPFGIIRYYRKPHTMEQNIQKAIKLYSGDKEIGIFVDYLEANLNGMNYVFDKITALFENAGIQDFMKLPDDLSERGVFAKLFKSFNEYLEAARIQGFLWEKLRNEFEHKDGKANTIVDVKIDKLTYNTLAKRYSELAKKSDGSGVIDDIPFEIEGYLTEIDSDKIDSDYMNSRFDKYLRTVEDAAADSELVQQTLEELQKSFASLSQEEQKYAHIFIHDIQSKSIAITANKTFREYITEYQSNAKDVEIRKLTKLFGLDETKLRALMSRGVTESSIDDYGRFRALKETVDKAKARAYFEAQAGQKIRSFEVNIKAQNLLKRFVLEGGFEV